MRSALLVIDYCEQKTLHSGYPQVVRGTQRKGQPKDGPAETRDDGMT